MITTLVLIGYYLWLFVLRPVAAYRGSGQVHLPSRGPLPQFEFPPLQTLDAVVFAIFAALSLMMAMSLFGYRASFKPADVDVLFSTPVNPKIVLAFRMLRDYLATLIVPIILVGLTWRSAVPDFAQLFRNVPNPQSTGYALRAMTIAFILTSLAWVTMGYALSMYLNRNDRNSIRRKKMWGWGIGLAHFAIVGYLAFFALKFTKFGDFVQFMGNAVLRIFFFVATFATKIVMGPLDGTSAESLVGGAILLAIAGICVALTLRQAEWMYDQAAVRGFGTENIRQLHRKGDVVGVMAESARQGKLKVKRWGWFQRLNWRGFSGLVWKDLLVQWRSVKVIVFIFVMLGVMIAVLNGIGASQGLAKTSGYAILFASGFITFMIANMLSQTGFSELLRRVDLQKPLPFSSAQITTSEIFSKALPSMLIPLLVTIVSLAFLPLAWPFGLAACVFFPTVGLLICAVMCLIVLIFPDIDDIAQRGFRSIVSLLGTALALAPGALVFVGIATFLKLLVLGALVGAGINLAIAVGIIYATGGLYSSFNPSE